MDQNHGETSTNIETTLPESTAVAPDSFLAYLQQEFVRRRTRNARYSIRAFARAVGVDQSLLTKILNGKREVSQQMVFKIALALQLSDQQIERFVKSGEKLSLDKVYRSVSEDELSVMTDWYSFAILELAQTKNFEPSSLWISQRLGISESEVVHSIAKLRFNRMIEINDDGTWKVISASSNWVNTKNTNLVRKKIQKQYLAKAEEAIDLFDIDKRESYGMTIAMNPLAIPEVKRKIKQFNEEIRNFINSYEIHEEVYHLSLGFFPLTRKKSENNNE